MAPNKISPKAPTPVPGGPAKLASHVEAAVRGALQPRAQTARRPEPARHLQAAQAQPGRIHNHIGQTVLVVRQSAPAAFQTVARPPGTSTPHAATVQLAKTLVVGAGRAARAVIPNMEDYGPQVLESSYQDPDVYTIDIALHREPDKLLDFTSQAARSWALGFLGKFDVVLFENISPSAFSTTEKIRTALDVASAVLKWNGKLKIQSTTGQAQVFANEIRRHNNLGLISLRDGNLEAHKGAEDFFDW